MSSHTKVASASQMHEILWGGDAQVFGFGMPHDWNLRRLKNPEDLSNPNNSLVALILSTLSNKCSVKRFLAPSPLNDQGIFCHQFGDRHSFAGEKIICLPHSEAILCRNFQAEGVVLESQSAFVIAAADCIVTVGKLASGQTVAFHAGRDSLFDRELLTSNSRFYKHESVVLAMLSHLGVDSLIGSQWWLSPSISPGSHFEHRWDDPVYGNHNERMVNFLLKRYGRAAIAGKAHFGHIDVRAILAAQLCEYGAEMRDIKISPECTYLATEPDNSPRWNSNRRESKKMARNLFVVINHG